MCATFIYPPIIYAASGHRYVSPSSSKLMMGTKKQMVISYKCHALSKGRGEQGDRARMTLTCRVGLQLEEGTRGVWKWTLYRAVTLPYVRQATYGSTCEKNQWDNLSRTPSGRLLGLGPFIGKSGRVHRLMQWGHSEKTFSSSQEGSEPGGQG